MNLTDQDENLLFNNLLYLFKILYVNSKRDQSEEKVCNKIKNRNFPN